MAELAIDGSSVEHKGDDVFVTVYSLDGDGFPHEIEIHGMPWEFHGNGFMTISEANRFAAKATYKMVREDSEEGSRIQLY